jgi:hypothetical protein
MATDIVLAYAPAAAYLLVVAVVLAATGRFPPRAHLALLVLGLAARAAHDGPVVLVAVPVAAVVFVVGVLIGKRLISGVGLLTATVAAALLPPDGWPGLLLGLLAAAVLGAISSVRRGGAARLHMVTGETLGAMGLRGAAVVSRPSLALLPVTRDDDAPADRADGAGECPVPVSATRGSRLYLAPFLLAGVLAWAAVRAVAG